jgi:hypothetical protein
VPVCSIYASLEYPASRTMQLHNSEASPSQSLRARLTQNGHRHPALAAHPNFGPKAPATAQQHLKPQRARPAAGAAHPKPLAPLPSTQSYTHGACRRQQQLTRPFRLPTPESGRAGNRRARAGSLSRDDVNDLIDRAYPPPLVPIPVGTVVRLADGAEPDGPLQARPAPPKLSLLPCSRSCLLPCLRPPDPDPPARRCWAEFEPDDGPDPRNIPSPTIFFK